MKSFSACLALSLALSASAIAHADTVYATAAGFVAATSGLSGVDFSAVSIGAANFVTKSNPFTLNGVTFSASGTSTMNVNDPAYYGTPYAGGNYLTVFGGTDILTITFPASTAVGFSFGGLFSGLSIPVTLSDGFTDTVSTLDSIEKTSTLDFVGFTSTTPITSIVLDLPVPSEDRGNSGDAIDNVTYGTANVGSPVPEPASYGLVLTGILGVAGAIRRRMTV